MRKLFLPLLGVLLILCGCGGSRHLDGAFFTENQDCLYLDRTESVVESRDSGIYHSLEMRQSRNKIKIYQRRYRRAPLHFLTKRATKYYFQILRVVDEDSLLVRPISKKAKKLFGDKPYLLFLRQERFDDPTNYFNTLTFHSSRCYGFCHDLHLQLDNAGNLKVTDNGTSYKGAADSGLNLNYFGKVSSDDMYRLKTLLRHSQLKTLVWPKRGTTDEPFYTLLIDQYDTSYAFRARPHDEPMVSVRLTNFLKSLFHYPELKRVDTTWTYKNLLPVTNEF